MPTKLADILLAQKKPFEAQDFESEKNLLFFFI